MKKVETTYSHPLGGLRMMNIAINEEFPGHINLYEGNETCSGVLRHWGTKKELIAELEEIIEVIKGIC